MTLSQGDVFGLSEEKKRGWVLLQVSDAGHPTFMCGGCYRRECVTAKGAELPGRCPGCKKALSGPVVGNHVARAHLTKGGHANLVGDLARLPEDERRIPAFRVRVRPIAEVVRNAEREWRSR